MKVLVMFGMLSMLLLSSGCVSLRVGTDNEMPAFKLALPGAVYADYTGVPAYNGTIFRASILRASNDGAELFGIHLWPLGGLDLGLVGARFNILGLEAGAGTLFYAPGPMKEEF